MGLGSDQGSCPDSAAGMPEAPTLDSPVDIARGRDSVARCPVAGGPPELSRRATSTPATSAVRNPSERIRR